MKKLTGFIAILLAIAPNAWAATGDILAVRIPQDSLYTGYAAEIDIEGLALGGTYDFGIGVNNDPDSAKVVFTVLSPGFDDEGDSTTVTHLIIGTHEVHQLYPNQTTADEDTSGTTLTVRIALDDIVYVGDVLTVDIEAGFYTAGGTPNNAANDVAVTNNSTEAYPKVIVNWSWPGWQRITGATFDVKTVAFHRSARDSIPAKCVRFIATDEGSHADTTFVTTLTTEGDSLSVTEYIGTLSSANLTQGDLVTVNFCAYPIIGDKGSLVNTADGVNTMPTPLYAPQYWLCDKTGAYGTAVAVVDTLGNDGTGVVVAYSAFNPSSPPNAYKTIAGAANAIRTYNGAEYSHTDHGGAIIYLKEGSHAFTGGTVTAANAETWVTITKFPGTTRANVLLASTNGTKQVSEKLHLLDIKMVDATVQVDNTDYVWVDQCDLYGTNVAPFYRNICHYFTDCTINSDVLRPYYATASRALIRGCVASSHGYYVRGYTILGNRINFTAEGLNDDFPTGPLFENVIVAYNYLSSSDPDMTPIVSFSDVTLTQTHGIALVQNVIECHTNPVYPCKIAADDAYGNPVNNVLIWYNTMVGEHPNFAYNEIIDGSGPDYRKNWSFIGNVLDDWNFVTDGHEHGGTIDATAYGNHQMVYGAGMHGNAILNRIGTTNYDPRFYGLMTIDTGDTLYPNFTNDLSYVGGNGGGGNYTPTRTSPFLSLIGAGKSALPYDLAGTARKNDGTGASGAYELFATSEVVRNIFLDSTDSTYTTSRDMDEAENSGSSYLALGQRDLSGYQVMRTFTAFPIPAMTSATKCTLYAWGSTNESDDDFNIVILSAHDSSPAYTVADYSHFDGRVTGGAHTGTALNETYSSTSFVLDGWNVFEFNAAGLDSLVAASGDTLWLAIISANDYTNTAPTESHNEYVVFDALEDEGHEPYLLFEYVPESVTGWSHKIMGAANVKSVNGILVENIKKIMGVE